jgi:hypothetical protein
LRLRVGDPNEQRVSTRRTGRGTRVSVRLRGQFRGDAFLEGSVVGGAASVQVKRRTEPRECSERLSRADVSRGVDRVVAGLGANGRLPGQTRWSVGKGSVRVGTVARSCSLWLRKKATVSRWRVVVSSSCARASRTGASQGLLFATDCADESVESVSSSVSLTIPELDVVVVVVVV